MKAALAARSDPALMIAGRTSALKIEGIEGTLARAKAYRPKASTRSSGGGREGRASEAGMMR